MQVGTTIYLDYQAATPVDPRVRKAMNEAAATLFANPHAADHVLGWRAAAAIDASARKVANLFGIQGDDVIFTSGASEANAMVIRTAEAISQSKNGAEIIVGAADHSSIIQEAEQSHLTLRQIPLDGYGAPDPQQLEHMISDTTALVSLIGVNNESGAIADLRALAMVCSGKQVALHVDLSQAPLALDLDLVDLDISYATVSAHKLYGPKGIGALLTGPGCLSAVSPIIVGAGQQSGRRGGTMATELAVGFGEACRIISREGQDERKEVSSIRNRFVEILQNESSANLIGPLERRHQGNALMRFPGQNGADLLAKLQPQIAASTQSACSSGSIEPSHVLLAMGYDHSIASECIRFSFGRYSTIKQAETAAGLINEAISTYV